MDGGITRVSLRSRDGEGLGGRGDVGTGQVDGHGAAVDRHRLGLELGLRARAAVDSWVRNQSGLDALDVSYRNGVVRVDLAGSAAPAT